MCLSVVIEDGNSPPPTNRSSPPKKLCPWVPHAFARMFFVWAGRQLHTLPCIWGITCLLRLHQLMVLQNTLNDRHICFLPLKKVIFPAFLSLSLFNTCSLDAWTHFFLLQKSQLSKHFLQFSLTRGILWTSKSNVQCETKRQHLAPLPRVTHGRSSPFPLRMKWIEFQPPTPPVSRVT